MPFCIIIMIQGRVVQSWVNITRVSARFEFWYESLKSKLIIHLNSFCQQAHDWMLLKLTEKIIRENAFEQKKKKPGLWANWPSNNWAWIIIMQNLFSPISILWVH